MNNSYVAYVGSYTHESSNGIHIYDMNVENGMLEKRAEVAIDNPSYLTMSHSEQYLYSICDQGITAFQILENGDLKFLNTKSINGMRGCHISITQDDRFLIVSGFHDGKLTVMCLNEDGSIGEIADQLFHKGIGSVSERSFCPHISNAVFTPDEELLCVCDLGLDQIKLYQFNHDTGKLKLYDIIRSQLQSAPKKIMFSQDGKFAYVACELKNYINVYSYDKFNDKYQFELIQNVSTLSKSHNHNSAASDIIFSNDGNHLLCSNAGDNTITIFNVDKQTGMLSMLSSLPISGDYPKYIKLFPDNKHILSLNNESNSITFFTIHFDRGLLVMNSREQSISRPNNMVIKKLNS